MPQTPHRSPSAGAIIKKIVEINPELTTREVIEIMNQSTRARGAEAGEFAGAEVIDEEKALKLARETLNAGHR
jgi:hypothetical protein